MTREQAEQKARWIKQTYGRPVVLREKDGEWDARIARSRFGDAARNEGEVESQ